MQKTKKYEKRQEHHEITNENIENNAPLGSPISLTIEEISFRKRLGFMTSGITFNAIIILLILLNDAIQATESYPEDNFTEIRKIIYFMCLTVFIIETILRIISETKIPYFCSKENILDLIIICGSIIHTVIISNGSPILCLRSFKMFTLIQINRFLKKIITIFGEALISVFMLCLLLFIFIYIYAIVGSQFFAGLLKFNAENKVDLINGSVPRRNYDSLEWALITTFHGLLGDNWYEAMQLAVKALGWQYSLYHCSLYLLGKILLHHLFVAVLLSLFRISRVTKTPENQVLSPSRKKTVKNTPQHSARIQPYNNNSPIDNRSQVDIKSPTDRSSAIEKSETNRKENNQNEIIQVNQFSLDKKIKTFAQHEIESMAELGNPQRQGSTGSAKGISPSKRISMPSGIQSFASMDLNKMGTKYSQAYFGQNNLKVPEIQIPIGREDTGNVNAGQNFTAAAVETSDRPLAHKMKDMENIDKIEEHKLENENEEEKSCWKEIWQYAKESSLFIFHKSWTFRIWISEWVTPFDEESYYQHVEYLEDVEFVDSPSKSGTFHKASTNVVKSNEKEELNRTAFLTKKTRSNIFETLILIFIVLSIVTLIIDNPLYDPNSAVKVYCVYVNFFFTCVFSAEAVLKIIAMDFIWSSSETHHAYLASGWNVLDFVVVITSLLGITNVSDVQILKTLKAIRALRVLKPLKMSNKYEQLKLLITSLTEVIPSLILLVTITFFYIFSAGVIITTIFKGRVYTCSVIDANIKTRLDCEAAGGHWDKVGHGFDNIGDSILSLIQMITFDNWYEVMLSMVDAKGIDEMPEQNNNPFWAIFAFVFIIIGGVVLLGMYTCILFECFNSAKLEYCGAVNCTINELHWINIQRYMLRRSLCKKAEIPTSSIRLKCLELSSSSIFYYLDMLVVASIIILYSFKNYGTDIQTANIIDALLYVCIIEANIYCWMKLIGQGSSFFQSVWNQYFYI